MRLRKHLINAFEEASLLILPSQMDLLPILVYKNIVPDSNGCFFIADIRTIKRPISTAKTRPPLSQLCGLITMLLGGSVRVVWGPDPPEPIAEPSKIYTQKEEQYLWVEPEISLEPFQVTILHLRSLQTSFNAPFKGSLSN